MSMGQDLAVKDRRGTVVYHRWVGSYTAFHEFRIAWARHLGFDLGAMRDPSAEQLWQRQPIEFFFRQDCEGTLSWRQAEAILRQARKDAPKLPRFEHQFQVLMEACELAVKHKTPLIFR